MRQNRPSREEHVLTNPHHLDGGSVLEGVEDGNKLLLLVVERLYVFECGGSEVAALESALELEDLGPVALKHTVDLQLGLLELLKVTVLGGGADAGLELIEQFGG